MSFKRETPRSRTWILSQIDDHHYTATLTDAAGPVQAEAYGDLFHRRHAMKAPVGGRMRQWLDLQPDNRRAVNEATIRVLGVLVARLSELSPAQDRRSRHEEL